MTQKELLGLLSKEEKTAIRAEYGNRCSICGSTGGTRALSIEHDHAMTKRKITCYKTFGMWKAALAHPTLRTCEFFEAPTRAEALKKARTEMVRQSIRGICCYWCNSGLKWFKDNPGLLLAAANYISRFRSKLYGRKPATIVWSEGG
jgi:hypothetical protein